MKIKAEARSVEEQIIERREFYDNEQRNNNERQLQMSTSERQAAKLRTQYDDAEKTRVLYESEVKSMEKSFHLSRKKTLTKLLSLAFGFETCCETN